MRLFFAVLFIGIFTTLHQVKPEERYTLRVGDTIEVSIFQDQEHSPRMLKVQPDGRISHHLAGHLQAAGLTLEHLQAKFKLRLKKFYKSDVRVTVSIQNHVEHKVSVFGAVQKPGDIPLIKARLTVLEALAHSGGFQPYAATHRIKVTRHVNGELESMVLDYDSADGKKQLMTLYVRDGDTIDVPERDLLDLLR